MDKEAIVVIDEKNESRTISRYEYYMRLMKQVKNEQSKGVNQNELR